MKTDISASGDKSVNKSLMIANKISEKLKNFPINLVDKNVSNVANLIYFNVIITQLIQKIFKLWNLYDLY